MQKYVVIRTLMGPPADGAVLGYAKHYANGRWAFEPAVYTGRKRVKGKTFKSFEDCLPMWTGGLSSTRSELCL